MKLALFALLVVLACAVVGSKAAYRPQFPFTKVAFPTNSILDSRVPPYKTLWYTQTLDHFNFANSGTFEQRYLVVDQYWKPSHPILLYTGNEGDIMMFYNNTGFMFELAKEWKALVVFVEHRYYGKSLPFGGDSYKPSNLGWLTVEQTLADFAQLLRSFKQENPQYQQSPVLAFGGSYGGMLTAWFRMAYPHLVAGGLASSAPMTQFVGLYRDYSTFSQIVTQDYTKADPICSDRIREGFKHIHHASPSDYAKISHAFKLCKPIASARDLAYLSNYAQSAVIYMAMANYPEPTTFMKPLPAWPVEASCRIAVTVPATDVYGALAAITNVYYNFSGTLPCNNWEPPGPGDVEYDGWDYQACSELVLPSSSTGVDDFFPPDPFVLEDYTRMCQRSLSVTPRYTWIPLQYGGFNISSHSNIIFSNGDLDPWSGGSILHTIKPSLPAIMIERAAHHLDLRFSSPADPASVVTARRTEIAYFLKWARQWYDQENIPSPL